jgi:hypothetical protein
MAAMGAYFGGRPRVRRAPQTYLDTGRLGRTGGVVVHSRGSFGNTLANGMADHATNLLREMALSSKQHEWTSIDCSKRCLGAPRDAEQLFRLIPSTCSD